MTLRKSLNFSGFRFSHLRLGWIIACVVKVCEDSRYTQNVLEIVPGESKKAINVNDFFDTGL